ncbi:hypothetical protein BaRGS_00003712 [Batillaria attramentaria]|uniref:CCHC-type domain-containing protein n=1 Tax=Batillaria attramentaria TaxID=370345 RepID=A0ABD0M0E2_9CAEN
MEDEDLLSFSDQEVRFRVLDATRAEPPDPFADLATIAAESSTENHPSQSLPRGRDVNPHQLREEQHPQRQETADSGVVVETLQTMMAELISSQHQFVKDCMAERERMTSQQEQLMEKMSIQQELTQDALHAIRTQPSHGETTSWLGASPVFQPHHLGEDLHSTAVKQADPITTTESKESKWRAGKTETPIRRTTQSAVKGRDAYAPGGKNDVRLTPGEGEYTTSYCRPAEELWPGRGRTHWSQDDQSPSVTFGAEPGPTDPSSTSGAKIRETEGFTSYGHYGDSTSSDVRPKRKLDSYDGKTSWKEYHVQFEMFADAHGWSDRQKAIELATSLKNQAVGVLATLEPCHRYNYDALVAALEARFEPRHQTEMHRAGLRVRTRKRGESLTDLAHDIKKMTRKAFPAAKQEVCEQLTLNAFIDSLNDAEMEWNVYQGKPETIEQAVTLAMEYESFVSARKTRKAYQTHNLRAVEANDDKAKKQNAGATSQNKTELRINQCRYCLNFGHWAKNCRQKSADMKRGLQKASPNQDKPSGDNKSGNGQ